MKMTKKTALLLAAAMALPTSDSTETEHHKPVV